MPLLRLSLLLALLAAPAFAAPPPQAAAEIEQLIRALGSSGCDFQRNGTWHTAVKAEAHLRRKYEWLLERDMLGNAEQFIERAATQSSLSGRAYQVRCPGKPVVPASSWLTVRLQQIRGRTPNAR
jgi:hypothetical protein